MYESFYDFRGNKIHYVVYGEQTGKAPLLCIHGGPGASHNYLLALKELSSERQIIFYDQLGCGKSDRPLGTDYMNINYYYEELKALVEHLGYDKIHILGQSFGGTLALEFLLNTDCHNILSVIFASPALSSVQFTADAQKRFNELPPELSSIINKYGDIDKVPADEAAQIGEYFFINFVVRNTGECPELAETFESMNNEIYNFMWGPSEFSVVGSLKDYDRTNELSKIKIPVLFTCGRYDEVSADTCKTYSEAVPLGSLNVFENSSHMAHIEEKESFLISVGDFIRKIEKLL